MNTVPNANLMMMSPHIQNIYKTEQRNKKEEKRESCGKL